MDLWVAGCRHAISIFLSRSGPFELLDGGEPSDRSRCNRKIGDMGSSPWIIESFDETSGLMFTF